MGIILIFQYKSYIRRSFSIGWINFCRGSSVVERKPEELGVVGSIPTPGTTPSLLWSYGGRGQSSLQEQQSFIDLLFLMSQNFYTISYLYV
jgi:hypothetical protein